MTQDNPTEASKLMDVQDILKQLEVNEGTFPREAVAQAVEQREAMTPELLRILEYARDSIEDIAERPDYFAHIYAMFLLAQFREPRAYPLIVQFVSLPEDIIMDIAEELVTEDLCRILASVSCGDASLMVELAENESANDCVRDAALRGLITLVACGEQTREDVLAYYQSFFRGRLPRAFSMLWNMLVASSTDLYPDELYEDIKKAYADGLIEPFYISLEDIEATLKKGKERVLEDLRTNKSYSLITDTISELEGWACFRSKDRPARTTLPDIEVPLTFPDIQTLTKKSQRQSKDKRKRKLTKASRRKNRR